LSVESTLRDLDTELSKLTAEQCEEVTATLTGVVKMVTRAAALPSTLNDALEAAVFTVITRSKMRGESYVLQQVRESAEKLPRIAEIVRRLK